MRKLVCKACGNAEFYVLNVRETLCKKCGLRLTHPSDYRREESQHRKEQLYLETKRQAEAISKISLLKRKIDQCLDDRDQEKFKQLTYELRVCQYFLKTGRNDAQTRFKDKIKQQGQQKGLLFEDKGI
ncbi:IDEAL domain-containing protein [Neobacillus cucumis]|uniref:IDEAL domain-containing protein n=1 Tax=Neobacillus cucumis TaxID=1740721 RepID=UPI0018DF69AB|nr:IDEAL domain-containing protein [Neobacillus cucumis]MBI0578070.1 IDEAL domain-containing protein [Neobacillus cucumis]WHY91781.1 IDEAL domain-containing protein [Neobacillus cucumis]